MKLKLWYLVAAAGALGACIDVHKSPTAGVINSLQLVLHDPSPDALGTPANPITSMQATFDVLALDENGQQMSIEADVDVFISFGGVKAGATSMCGSDTSGNLPITTLHLSGGQILNQTIQFPTAYGATSIWLDELVSHATGASPTLYFRNPYIADVQTPADPTATNATFCSEFNNRFITIDHAKAGGQLVVTSVFIDAFAVTDTGDTNFNNIYLYAFGKPPTYIVPGKVITSFSGNYSKFVGFTELNFPLFTAADDTVPLAPVPDPIQLAWIDIGNEMKLLGADAGVVEYTGIICAPAPPNPGNDPNIQKTDDSWNKYNQFVVDGNQTCDSFTNFAVELPSKQFGTFDPIASTNYQLTVRGMLQNHSGQNPVVNAMNQMVSCSSTQPCATGSCIQNYCYKGVYNFWTILPRDTSDIISVVPISSM